MRRTFEVASTARVESALSAQRDYARRKHRRGKLGLAIPEAFVRGIRHIGYRSNIEAIGELVDNSMQAYAERVEVVFGYEGGASTKKPCQLAIVDDGHGMYPGMLQLAMMWGGTHRENDRKGLGRYGYGLPCATVSIGRRFTILSRIRGGRLHGVTLDLDALDAGDYLDADGDIALPPVRRMSLPIFLKEHLTRVFPKGWGSGTIVLIEKLDRLNWSTTLGLTANLVRHFGVTYHKLLSNTSIYVGEERVLPTDPLFLTAGCEYYALDNDRAQPLDPIRITVKTRASASGEGEITLRYAWLPPSFGSIDKSRDAVGLNANLRFSILKDYHGIIFSRNGRIIDVQTRAPWTAFINNDRYIRLEIEFSASLDEMFGVTTSKQQISVSSEIWNCLREAGMHKAIEHLRGKVRAAKSDRRHGLQPGDDAPPGKDVNPRAVPPGTPAQADKVANWRLRDKTRPRTPILRRPRGSSHLVLNDDHPAFGGGEGQRSSQEIGVALQSLLTLIGDRLESSSELIRDEYCCLLMRWAQAIDPRVQSISDVLGETRQ